MNRLFVSGYGRSGTTLLTNILSCHSDIKLLIQPFPFLFIELKKKFLKTLGRKDYFVLNDNPFHNDYEINDFVKFLSEASLNQQEIDNIFYRMRNYNGQVTKIKNFANADRSSLINLYDSLILNHQNTNAEYFGSKEVLCEEFIPFFLKHGSKIIIIIRDPRDVVASINYPQTKSYFGGKKPLLFLLRCWRRSIHFYNYYKSNDNFHFIKYEDLVRNTDYELDKISKFLNLTNFKENFGFEGIRDKDSNLIMSNTSHGNRTSRISKKSINVYLNLLSDDEIKFIESVCFKEMSFLEYQSNFKPSAEYIRNYKEKNICDVKFNSKQYYLSNDKIAYELNYFKDKNL